MINKKRLDEIKSDLDNVDWYTPTIPLPYKQYHAIILELIGFIEFIAAKADIRLDAPLPIQCQFDDKKLADDFAEKGTLMHFLIKRGFMPTSEKDAEAILENLIKEAEAK